MPEVIAFLIDGPAKDTLIEMNTDEVPPSLAGFSERTGFKCVYRLHFRTDKFAVYKWAGHINVPNGVNLIDELGNFIGR